MADQLKFPMCTGVHPQAYQTIKKQKTLEAGLLDAHAYSLLQAKVITIDDGTKERLLQIRNPWGFVEWNGDWSDKSTRWTESTKQQVDFLDQEDGTFWIAWCDYVKFFYLTTIGYHLDSFVENTVEDMHDLNGFGLAKFTLAEDHPDYLVLSLDQINARFLDEPKYVGNVLCSSYNYAPIKLVLTQLVERKGKTIQVYIHGDMGNDSHIMLEFR